jgi:hypothetical protein
MRQTGSDRFEIVDEGGTTGSLEYLYRDRDTHVAYVEGAYRGSLFGRMIAARGILVLKSGYVREANGRCYVTTRLDAFVHIEPGGVEFLTKTFQPAVGKVADNNFTQTAAFVASMSRAAERNLNGMRRLAVKLDVRPEVRQQLVQVTDQLALRAAKASARAAGPDRASLPDPPALAAPLPITTRERR